MTAKYGGMSAKFVPKKPNIWRFSFLRHKSNENTWYYFVAIIRMYNNQPMNLLRDNRFANL